MNIAIQVYQKGLKQSKMLKQLEDPYFEQLIEAEEQLKTYSEARNYLNR